MRSFVSAIGVSSHLGSPPEESRVNIEDESVNYALKISNISVFMNKSAILDNVK